MLYHPQSVQAYFDNYGTREWDRLEQNLQGRIKFLIHQNYLEKYVPEGLRVLDAGCGPGRFALELTRRCACLTMVDISPVQLGMARERLLEAGLLEKVEALICLDIIDLQDLEDASFDVVVCYGAVVSYIYDRYETALKELVRVLRPGGRFLISVCSLYGTLQLIDPYDEDQFLEPADSHIDWQAVLSGDGVVYSRPGSSEFRQPMVLFTSRGLQNALEKEGLRVVEMAAVNPIVSEASKIPRITANPKASAALAELELALCSQPGLVDTGEHLLAVAEKPVSNGQGGTT